MGQEAKGPAVKIPDSELAWMLLANSLTGAKWPGSEKAVNHTLAVAATLHGIGSTA